jgi:hypothetical protein
LQCDVLVGGIDLFSDLVLLGETQSLVRVRRGAIFGVYAILSERGFRALSGSTKPSDATKVSALTDDKLNVMCTVPYVAKLLREVSADEVRDNVLRGDARHLLQVNFERAHTKTRTFTAKESNTAEKVLVQRMKRLKDL